MLQTPDVVYFLVDKRSIIASEQKSLAIHASVSLWSSYGQCIKKSVLKLESASNCLPFFRPRRIESSGRCYWWLLLWRQKDEEEEKIRQQQTAFSQVPFSRRRPRVKCFEKIVSCYVLMVLNAGSVVRRKRSCVLIFSSCEKEKDKQRKILLCKRFSEA